MEPDEGAGTAGLPSRHDGREALDQVVDGVARMLHWCDPNARGTWPDGPGDDGTRDGRKVDLVVEPRLAMLRSRAEDIVGFLRGRLAAAGSVDLNEARIRVGALLGCEASVGLVPGTPHADGYATGVRDALGALGDCGSVPAGSPLVPTLLGRLADAMRPFADVGTLFAFGHGERADEVAVHFDTGGGLTRGDFIALSRARKLLLSGMPRDTAYEAMVTAKEHWERRALAAEAALKVGRAT